MTVIYPKFTFTERAAAGNLTDSEILNSNNAAGSDPPSDADVVVAGAGIHGLIYAIHAAKKNPGNLRISVIEKNGRPGYKIGESTLPAFGLWCREVGLTGAYLLRLFGLKEGLAFYILDRENPDRYTDFCSCGTLGTVVNAFQLERPMSELLLTLFAQRNGVNVYHGRQVDFNATKVKGGIHNNKISIAPGKYDEKPAKIINSSFLVDATGRFRQFACKTSHRHRFEGFNCDAFWGYFTYPKDESKIPFRFYEGCNTNHLCFPEGWAWVIRLLSWEGSPIPNLMDMINYLLDCAEAGVPSDEVPCSEELAKMFGVKCRWVTSIGFAIRNDVKYPEDMSAYGSREAERKFNYFVEKYPRIKEFMTHFDLIENLYGPGTTWYIRKSLAYQSPVVSGPGWLAVGDACGFTNPLYSPGINVGMSTTTYAAELTGLALDEAKKAPQEEAAELSMRKIFAPYDDFTKRLIPALNQMNCFNYLCFRDPRLGVQVGCLWQYIAGLERNILNIRFDNYVDFATHWCWGCMDPKYNTVARKVIELLAPIPLEESVSDTKVREIIEFSDRIKDVRDAHCLKLRWEGFLRHFDQQLNFIEEKTAQDKLAAQCSGCGSWLVCRVDWRKCYTCGQERTEEEAAVKFDPPLTSEELK